MLAFYGAKERRSMRSFKYLFVLLLLALSVFNEPAKEASAGSREKRCPIHHVVLKKEKLPIIYGEAVLPCESFSRWRAASKYFPYANSAVYGGCVITDDSPKYKEVLYCEKCREVEKNWPCLETETTPMIEKLP